MLWVNWTMGYQPETLLDNDRVDVMFSDGYELSDLPARSYNWQNERIIAYRRKHY